MLMNSLHSNLSLIANRILCQHSLACYPVCTSEYIKHLGRAFWHVVHQLPTICVCTTHGCSLLHIVPLWKTVYLPAIDNVLFNGLPSSTDAKWSQFISESSHSSVLSCPEAFNHSYRKRLYGLFFVIRIGNLTTFTFKLTSKILARLHEQKILWLLTQTN